MKKILLFLVCISFCGCDLFDKDKDICGCINPYRLRLSIMLDNIKDPKVKSIKVTLKNLDGIEPEFDIHRDYRDLSLLTKNSSGIYSVTEQRERRQHVYNDGEKKVKETYYFTGAYFRFIPPERWDFIVGKKRIYELKTYINGKLFFTKNFSFTPEGYQTNPSNKVEIDNMDDVFELRSNGVFIKITDADIKKWLDGKP